MQTAGGHDAAQDALRAGALSRLHQGALALKQQYFVLGGNFADEMARLSDTCDLMSC